MHDILRDYEAQMSAAAIRFGTENRNPESGSVRLSESAPREDADAPYAPITRAPSEADAAGVCYEVACELDLVSAAKGGDQRAFVELCRRHSPSLKRRIGRIVRNRDDAEDVLQDTLIRAFSNLLRFRGQCSFRTWIMTIATNNCFMLLRKRRTHPETGFGLISAEGKEFEMLQVSDPMPDPEQVYARRQATHRLWQAVKLLPPGFRLILEPLSQA
jgi:RNA polymerase sigma-70 factor, ECF subfamily